MPSDEIRLYAVDMLRSWIAQGSETNITPTEANGVFILLTYTFYVQNMGSKHLPQQMMKFV